MTTLSHEEFLKLLTENLEKNFGPSPHKEDFLALFSACLSDIDNPAADLDNTGIYQLLVEVAWKWPGTEDKQWATLTGLCAMFFHRCAVESSMINLPEAGHA